MSPLPESELSRETAHAAAEGRPSSPQTAARRGVSSVTVRVILLAGLSSVGLAAVKITTGVLGNSYALIADGIESLTDIVASLVVLVGLLMSVRPADDSHPWGYGKLETLATVFVSVALLSAAGLIAWQSIEEIRTPHHAPAWYTLPVLVVVVVVKVLVARAISRRGAEEGSAAMEADSWHHLSDALTSGAAFVGISLALALGPGWESADDWAALLACGVIAWNGVRLGRGGLAELLEARVEQPVEEELRAIARGVDGVREVEKLRARKSGLGVLMEIHIEVDGDLTVTEGHAIAHAVKDALLASNRAVDVTVHVEPHGGVTAQGRSAPRGDRAA